MFVKASSRASMPRRGQRQKLFVLQRYSSEVITGKELKVAHRSRGRDLSERGRVHVRIETAELRHVQEVRRLSPNIDRPAVRECERFVDRQISDDLSWSSHRVPAHIPKLAWRRNRECRRVEPLRDRRMI